MAGTGDRVVWAAEAVWFAVTLAAAALALAAPDLVLLGWILVLPGLALSVAPMAFAVTLAVKVAGAPLRWWGRGPALALGLAATGIACVWVPLRANRAGWAALAEVTASDRSGAIDVLPPVVAVLTRDAPVVRERGLACGDLCLRLLYNGAVDEVIAGASRLGLEDGGPEAAGVDGLTAFRVERRSVCPEPPLVSRDAPLQVRVLSRIAAGECLIGAPAEPTALDRAGLWVVERRFGVNAPRRDAWDLGKDTLVGARFDVLVRDDADGQLVPRIRETSAGVHPLLVPLVIGPIVTWDGGVPALGFGFERRRVGPRSFDVSNPDRAARDARVFGAATRDPDVGLDPASPDELRDAVVAALDAEVDPARIDAVGLWYRALARQGAATDADLAVLARVVPIPLTDPQGLPELVAALGPSGAALAEPLARRIREAPLPADARGVSSASAAVARLPPGSAAAIEGPLVALAGVPVRRSLAWAAIGRLGDAGPEVVPLLTKLVAETGDPRARPPSERDDDQVAHGALLALCRLGPDAAPATDVLREMMARGIARSRLSNDERFAAELLVRIGREDLVDDAFRGSPVEDQLRFVLRGGRRDACR